MDAEKTRSLLPDARKSRAIHTDWPQSAYAEGTNLEIVGSPHFRSIAEAVVPDTQHMTPTEWQDFSDVIDRALARRPRKMRRQLSVFLQLLNFLSIARYGRSLHRASIQQRTSLLERIENSPLLLFRRGFWGIRTLVFMGYYARPHCGHALGYAAAARGWELRR